MKLNVDTCRSIPLPTIRRACLQIAPTVLFVTLLEVSHYAGEQAYRASAAEARVSQLQAQIALDRGQRGGRRAGE